MKFDLYDTIVKTIIKDPNDRQDLRVSIDVILKAAMIGLWHFYLFDESSLTVPSLVISIMIWPIYHLYLWIEIYEHKERFQLDHLKNGFRIFDQIQNFILLIGFAVLVFRDGYNTMFHIIVLVILIVDSALFILQILISCFKKKVNPAHNYQPTQINTDDQQLNTKQPIRIEIESEPPRHRLFYFCFIIAGLGVNIGALYIIFHFSLYELSLKICLIAISQIFGNLIILSLGCKIYLRQKISKQGTIFKTLSMIVQGLVAGATSMIYGMFFGFIIMMHFCVFLCAKKKDGTGTGDWFERECYIPYLNFLKQL